jgi:PAS domain S-box-containing protein
MAADFDFSDFFMVTPDLVWIAGKDGFLKNVNPAVCHKLGYSHEELLSKPVTFFIHPADVEKTLHNRHKLFKGEVLHNFQNRYINKSGDIVWLEWTSVFIADKEIVLGIAKDITDRTRIEKEVEEQYVKFKGLARHFKNRMEDDRKYFAVELHEELAQLLAVVHMDVSWLSAHTENLSDTITTRVGHALTVCKLMIKTIQQLAFSISPQMLNDFGLNDTMEWLCKEFSILTGIECSFNYHYDEHTLTNEMKLDFFRICQEAFADILDTAQAGKIVVSIKDTGKNIELSIHDSGNGFKTDLKSQGLTGIKERAKSINGKIALKNRPGQGSLITLTVEKQSISISTLTN